MDFITSIKTCFSNYANFNGRARRSEYWWFYLFTIIASLIPFLGIIVALGTIIPTIACGVRRMHDNGKSGWFLLIPIYNLILLCTDSQPGDNEYGPNPKTGISQDDLDEFGKQDV
jgi:uncharacterized membrane protein YhaH (DUF805 family)